MVLLKNIHFLFVNYASVKLGSILKANNFLLDKSEGASEMKNNNNNIAGDYLQICQSEVLEL